MAQATGYLRPADGAEVRPEWALARNASFIAARRERTLGVNLQGRSFLHEYDSANDPDGSILTLILTAPAVVASWINLQYFASTVDNHGFGSGNKVLHNLVGSHGVVQGNGGDLRTGLAEQSIYTDNGSWYHQPLRLQVIVESPLAAVESIVADLEAAGELSRHCAGRRNRYQIRLNTPLRHPVASGRTVRNLLEMVGASCSSSIGNA